MAGSARRWLALALLVAATTAAVAFPEPPPPPDDERDRSGAAAAEAKVERREKPLRFMDQILVTASRGERERFEEPATVEVLGAEDLSQRLQVAGFVDAFQETAGVSVQKTARGQGSPYVRGFTGFHNLMLIDGVRMNNCVLRSGPNQYWATIDPFASSRVELVKGPGSMLWGSDAVGGTVNVLSGDRWRLIGDSGTTGRLYSRWGEAEASSIARAEAAGSAGGRLGYSVGATLRDLGDLRAGGDTGRVLNSGHDELGLDAKLQYLRADDREVVLFVQSYRQEDVPRTEATVFSKPFRGTVAGTELRRAHDQERMLSYLRYRRSRPGSPVEEAEYTLSYQRTEEGRDRVRSNGRRDLSGFEVRTLGAQAQFKSATRWGALTYGVEAYRDSVDSFRTDFSADGSLRRVRIQGPIADDAAYESLGIYAQDELSTAGGRWSLVVGGRWSAYRLDAGRVEDPVTGEEFSLSDEWSHGVGSLRLLWRPARGKADRWRLFVSLAQAFRAPNLSDLTRLDATSAVETPTPGLRPEEYLTHEIGARYRAAELELSGSFFYTRIDDQIVQSPTGRFIDGIPEVQKSNVGDGFVQGVEMAVGWWPRPWLELWGNGSWMEGRVDQFLFDSDGVGTEVRAPVSRLVPWMAHGGVRFRPRSGRYWLELHGTAYADADKLALRDVTDVRRIPPGGTPGFAVVGVRGAIPLMGERLTLAWGVENLLDEDYRIHGSGQNMPGRNLVISLDWGWGGESSRQGGGG